MIHEMAMLLMMVSDDDWQRRVVKFALERGTYRDT
jgi:hypothetical protein